MVKRYKKRYRKRYVKKQDDLFEGVVGLIALGAAGLYFNRVGIPVNKAEIYSLIFTLFAIIMIVLIVVLVGGYILRKSKQKRFYRQQQFLFELQDLHPKEFEEWLAIAFEQQGYSASTTNYQNDHGIDVVLKKNGKKYAVQAKRYSGKNYVGEPAVRDFFGSYAHTDFAGGFFVTTTFFSKAAIEWAKNRNVTLIDGKALEKMMNRN